LADIIYAGNSPSQITGIKSLQSTCVVLLLTTKASAFVSNFIAWIYSL